MKTLKANLENHAKEIRTQQTLLRQQFLIDEQSGRGITLPL